MKSMEVGLENAVRALVLLQLGVEIEAGKRF